MVKERFIEVMTRLGEEFREAAETGEILVSGDNAPDHILTKAMQEAYMYNPWFIPRFVIHSFNAWARALEEEKIMKWIQSFGSPGKSQRQPLNVGVVMAGNIPMVGLHDLICVLASGNIAQVKLSGSDDKLIPALAQLIGKIDPEMGERIIFTMDKLRAFDAIIATGSNNTSRYFEYYFGKYPNIIRRNRNGVSVITGRESDAELDGLADDIFLYFGLGCRNVSKVYIPEGYDLKRLFASFEKYAFLSDMHKYRNNYDYQKSLLLINGIEHYDNGFLLVKEDASLISPVSVLHTQSYSSTDSLSQELNSKSQQIQCVVSMDETIRGAVLPGYSQMPELWDYADGMNTMDFLMKL